jgi:folate-binding protein YgfZ
MGMVQAQILEDRAVVALGGDEVHDFLQGLITNDVSACREDQALYAALLTPQGKILFDFFVVANGAGFLIDCAAARSGDLVKRLTMYRLRSKVEIALRVDLAVAAFWGEGMSTVALPDGVVFRDPRLEGIGARAIGPREAISAAIREAQAGDYPAHRIARGVPDSADLPPDTVFALDAGLEELNGVSFKKGCYVGQEVTSRMKHRASTRRRFLIAETDGEAPVFGTAIEAQGHGIGEWASAKGGLGLALVRLDRMAKAQDAHAGITSAGRSVRLTKPAWLNI